jgi:4-hydroxy-2-oxoheptanedioate aldolase
MSVFSAFRERVRSGEVLLGASVVFSDPRVTEALGPSVDFIWLELEHALMGPESVVGHVLAARAADVPLLMRVPAGTTAALKPALDSGVQGLIVPQIRSVAEVQAVIDDVRYAPIGRRGMGPVRPSNYGRRSPHEVLADSADDVFLAIQIETMEALEAVEQIAALPGLDSLVVGPTDLSASMGLLAQYDHPDVVRAIARIVSAAKANGLSVGVGVGSSAVAVAMVRHGIQWVQLSGADAYLWQRFEQLDAEVRAAFSPEVGSTAPRAHGQAAVG